MIRRPDCVSLSAVFCPGCSSCGSGESGSEMCALLRWCCIFFTVHTSCYPTLRNHKSYSQDRTPLAICVHSEDDVASSSQCTHLATRLPGTTTVTTRTEHHRPWHAVCSPDDGRKDAWNMLRNSWLPINRHLLHLVGLAFICTSDTVLHIKCNFVMLVSVNFMFPSSYKLNCYFYYQP